MPPPPPGRPLAWARPALCGRGGGRGRALWCPYLKPFDKSKGPLNNEDTDVGIKFVYLNINISNCARKRNR